MRTLARQLLALARLSLLELWRRHEVAGLLALAAALLVPLSAARPFGAAGAVRYLDEAALVLVWAFSLFIAVGTASRLFPPEFENRTVYALFAKPISRGRILIGKYLGALCATWSALALFYALFAIARGMRGGGWVPPDLLQAFALHLEFAAVAAAVALLGSLVLSPSANYVISGGLLAVMFLYGRRLPEYAQTVSTPVSWAVYAVYALAPHAEFFDMRQRVVHGWGGVSAGVILAVTLYAACYVALCLALAAAALRRRRT